MRLLLLLHPDKTYSVQGTSENVFLTKPFLYRSRMEPVDMAAINELGKIAETYQSVKLVSSPSYGN